MARESLNLKRPDLLREDCFIGGEWVGGDTRIDVTNPATGGVLASVPKFGTMETRRAIKEAYAAMPGWAARTAKDRSIVMRRWYDLMLANIDDLAAIMTAEQGKPLAESRTEIAYAAGFIEWFAEEGKRVYGDVIPSHRTDTRIVVIKQGIGVTAAITPWNFPAAMITRKAGPALAAGCAQVIKPATATPLSALALCVLAEEAGFPKGLISCVTGSAAAIAKEFTDNPLVQKISFTGSTDIGKQLMAACAAQVKKVSLELGGNAPFIVFDDGDLDAAVQGAIASKFRNAGQTCVCSNRLYAQASIYDAFVEKLSVAVRAMKVGNGADVGIEVGPMEAPEYARMVEAGCEGLVVYQETYDREVYGRVHTLGPKKDFDWRLGTPERGYAAGFRRLGIGALYGLADWRWEALSVAAHAAWLLRHCWKASVTISLPRLRPCAGEFEPLTHLGDRDLLQLLCAFRLFLPDVGLVMSTREPGRLRDGLVPLGVTMMSAGSHTEPGGYTGAGSDQVHYTRNGRAGAPEANAAGPSGRPTAAAGQFEIADGRSAAEVAAVLSGLGFEPVWKDWDPALNGTASGLN